MKITLGDMTVKVGRAAWGGFYCDVAHNGRRFYTGQQMVASLNKR